MTKNINYKQFYNIKGMKMKQQKRLGKGSENYQMEDLEESLLKDVRKLGLDQFESIYNKKKFLGEVLEHEKHAKSETKDNLAKIKQRVCQIEQLNQRVNKQAALMKSQCEKITEAHIVNKILMMEKIVKLQRQTQDLQRKKQQYYRIRGQHHQSSLANQCHLVGRLQRNRIKSVRQAKAYRQQLDQSKYQIFETKRQLAESIKQGKQRMRSKNRKIEEFKQNRARKNYTDKILSLQNTLEMKGNELQQLYQVETKQQKHSQATKYITNEYLTSFFATETI